MKRDYWAIGLAMLAGCSLTVGDDSYVAQPPASPAIDLTPEEPTAATGISASVVSPEPGINYSFTWRLFRGTDATGVTFSGATTTANASSVSVGQLLKGDRWEVTVTPSVASIGLEGEPSVGETVVVNAPAQLENAFLNSYRPVIGQDLQASPGRVIDPDGDNPTVTYRWSRVRNGTSEILRTATSMFTLGADTFPLSDPSIDVSAGDEILLEVTPNDGDDGSTISIGPLEVLADEARWYPGLPKRERIYGYPMVMDPSRGRFLMIDGGDIWQIPVRTTLPAGFARLEVDGTLPFGFGVRPFYDAANDRVLIVQQEQPDETGYLWKLYELVFQGAGIHPVLREIETSAEPRPLVLGSTVFFDEKNGTIFVYGGLWGDGNDGTPIGPFLRLDLGTATWAEVELTGAPGNIFVPGVTKHPTKDTFVILGGVLMNDDVQPTGTVDRVLEFDPATNTITTVKDDSGNDIVFSGVLLPAGAVTDAARNRTVFASGHTFDGSLLQPDPRAWVLDWNDYTITPIDAPAFLQSGNTASHDVVGGQYIFHPGGDMDFASTDAMVRLNMFTLEANDLRWTDTFQYGVSLPPSIAASQATSGTTMGIAGGFTSGSTLNQDIWSFDTAWLREETTGANPRFGIFHAGSRFGEHVLFGGSENPTSVSALVNDMTPLTRDRGSTPAWEALSVAGPEPEPRMFHTLFPQPEGCWGRSIFGYFGGQGAAGPLNDTGILDCTTAPCSWIDPVGAEAKPSPRHSVAMAAADGRLLMFGGRTSTGSVDELYTLNLCTGADAPWVEITDIVADPVHGTPSPRMLGSLVPITRSNGMTLNDVFLLTGGDLDLDSLDAWLLRKRSETQYEWQKVEVSGWEPTARASHSVSWNENVESLVVYGGTSRSDRFTLPATDDMWFLRLPPSLLLPE